MKVATLLYALISTVAARSLLDSFGSQEPFDDDSLNVPGKNPLKYCSAPDDDILQLHSVDLSPNPPKAGETLSIIASGNLTQDVKKGAKVRLQVKYGLITLIKQEVDLCDQVKNVDLDCPIKKGETKITKEVDLPKEIPPGAYNVLADAFTEDQEKITCLTAHVEFHR